MRNYDLESEEDPPHRAHPGGLSPGEFRELSPKDLQGEAERARQVAELVSALRNFAEHFGAAEVYQQAKVIYAETAEGKAGIEREAAQIVQHGSARREEGQSAPERPRKAASDRPPPERVSGAGGGEAGIGGLTTMTGIALRWLASAAVWA